GTGQIPSGMLCDWFGAHLLLGGSVVLWSLAVAVIAMATGLVSMALARVALGVAQASCYPVLTKVSKNWFPLEMRSTAQGLIATFFGRAGGAGAFFLFGTVLVGWCELNWRTAVMVMAGVGVLLGVLFLLLFRNTPREHPWANAAEADLIVAHDPEAAIATHARLDWDAFARTRSVWFLFLRSLLSNMADVLFVYWVPLYLLQLHGLSAASTGTLAALPLIGGGLGGLTSGYVQSRLVRRTGNLRLARCSMGFLGKSIAAGLMLATIWVADATLVTLMLVAVKFYCDMEQPAEWGTISDIGGR